MFKGGRMKILIVVLLVVMLFVAGEVSISAAVEAPAVVRKAAEAGVDLFLKNPGMTGKQKMGFRSQSELDNAFAGEGFQVFTIPPDRLINNVMSQNLSALVVPKDQWQFLINSTDGAKVLLTVDVMNGKWTPVSIGSAGLAKELGRVLEKWPVSEGYQYRLIRVYQAKSDFIELTQNGKIKGIVPLSSLNAVIGGKKRAFDPADILESRDVLDALRPAVRSNVEGSHE
jgi:hypothetical protein